MAAPRALMLAPVNPPGLVGGFPIILSDLAEQLRARGWQVLVPEGWESPPLQSGVTSGQRWEAVLKAWAEWTPGTVRYLVSHLSMPRSYYVSAAHNLRAAEAQIRSDNFELLLLHVDGTPPGLCALAAELTKRQGRPLVLVSMNGLSNELRAPGWSMLRQVAHAHLGGDCPRTLFRALRPAEVPLAIFASTHWQAEAVRAGLSKDRSRVIYFGVPLPPPMPRPTKPGRRILWVGRLSREKGLHLLLRALPALLQQLPDVTVTAIAAQGPPAYRELIEKLIGQLGLSSVVTLRPPVPRAALADAYATHDVLFFHSIFREPVALVLMEAFAAGLPVAASATPGTLLVEDGETCATYDPRRTESIVQALHGLLTDARVRERVAANAQCLVRSEFSLESMGESFDAILQERLSRAPNDLVDSART